MDRTGIIAVSDLSGFLVPPIDLQSLEREEVVLFVNLMNHD